MTIRKTLKILEEMKTQTLLNQTFSCSDAAKVKEFIEPYVKSRNQTFVDLNMFLNEALNEKHLVCTLDKKAMFAIDNAIDFLKLERNVEIAVFGIFLLGFGIAMVVAIFK